MLVRRVFITETFFLFKQINFKQTQISKPFLTFYYFYSFLFFYFLLFSVTLEHAVFVQMNDSFEVPTFLTEKKTKII